MAGHSKRHNIKHRKAAQDKKKSKLYANLAKIIQMAAKNGDDPSLNPSLETALTKARQAGLPKDVIKKAVDKGAGNLSGEDLVEVFYEGYGPGGIAMYIKCVTPNTNRSGANIRAILTKYGGSLGAPGSVSWQFSEKGEIIVEGMIQEQQQKGKTIQNILPLVEDDFEELLLETDAEDYQIDEGMARIITARDDFMSTVYHIEEKGVKIKESDLVFIAENTISLDEAGEAKLLRVIEVLEDDEDVSYIRHNAA